AAGIAGIEPSLPTARGSLEPAFDPDTVLVVLSGDVPLFGAEAIGRLIEAHREARAAATMVSATLEDPRGYGRVVRDPGGLLERVAETKEEADSTPEERQIREVNAGIYAFQASSLMRVLPRLSADNAQGELYLPQVLALLLADGLPVAVHSVEDPELVLGV